MEQILPNALDAVIEIRAIFDDTRWVDTNVELNTIILNSNLRALLNPITEQPSSATPLRVPRETAS